MKIADLEIFHHRVFSVDEACQTFRESKASVKVQLSRACRTGKLIRLKRGLYTFPKLHPDPLVMAQRMVEPSYHSLEYVLAQHSIIPQGVTAFTLVTSQKTQTYSNTFGNFSYRHLPPSQFFGIQDRNDGVLMATPEKALLDYLYLNSKKLKPDFACFQGERFDQLEDLDFLWLQENAVKYGSKKLLILVTKLDKYRKSEDYQAHR